MKSLALFDLDHTLIPTDSDHEWGRFMVRLGLVDGDRFAQQNDAFFADYKAGTLDIQAYLNAMLAPLAGYPRAQLDAWHEQFMHEVIRPKLSQAALDLVRRHQDSGDLCCIVTATNEFITRPIAHAFGVETLIACEIETVDGKPDSALTGRPHPDSTPSFREGKIARTESWLAALGKHWSDFDQSWFYSDSHNDIPLLEEVSDPVATNPDDKLRAHADAHGWRVLELFQ
jgi:HAD superfamily hydrolase (TIGR01490 family)